MFLFGAIINAFISKGVQKGNEKKQKLIDKRLNYTTEALNNIKTLKFYQWTKIFQEEIEKRREAELMQINRIRILLCILWSTLSFFPNTMSTASLYLNIKLGRTIDLATAYTVLIFFDKIRGPMSALPWIITATLELLVSMSRLQKYFDSDEINVNNFIMEGSGQNSIEISKSSFTWGIKAPSDKEEDKKKDKKINVETITVLKDFNLNVRKGEFVCIIGDVGSGKSSILSSIIGDLIPIDEM